jgi:hypothetical protein
MWFPLIKTLATVDLYCHFGTDEGTYRAARTLALLFLGFFLREISRVIPTEIEIVGERNEPFRTKLDAQHAPLAEFLINLDVSLQLRFPCEKDKNLQ